MHMLSDGTGSFFSYDEAKVPSVRPISANDGFVPVPAFGSVSVLGDEGEDEDADDEVTELAALLFSLLLLTMPVVDSDRG